MFVNLFHWIIQVTNSFIKNQSFFNILFVEEEQRSLHLSSEEHAAQFLQMLEKNANVNNNSNNSNNNNTSINSVSFTTSSTSNSSNGGVSSTEVETLKKLKLKEIVDKLPTSR